MAKPVATPNNILAFSQFMIMPDSSVPARDYQECRRVIKILACAPTNPIYMVSIANNAPLFRANNIMNLDDASHDAVINLMRAKIDEYIGAGKHFMLVVDVSYFPTLIIYIDTRKPASVGQPNQYPTGRYSQGSYERLVANSWRNFNVRKHREKLPVLIMNIFAGISSMNLPPLNVKNNLVMNKDNDNTEKK